MKVDIKLLKKAQKIKAEHSVFCQDCGETDPEGGFYPMHIWGPNSLTTLLCKPCEQKRRGV